jgi:heat-inducible transcriptional repressor
MRALEKRSEKILAAIVSDYISSGEPVGSRTVSKNKDIGLSAATIRNIMSDLTDLGYIVQPHISAGRIPTDLGYRFYVDTLLQSSSLSPEEQIEIESFLKAEGWDFREILKQTSSVLAGWSKQASVAAAIATMDQTFKTVEFIKIAEDRILVILVSTTGAVQSKIIYDEDGIKQETLERYSRILNDMLKDLDLPQARERIEQELAREKTRFDAMLAKALRLCHMILVGYDSREVFIDGQINFLDDPEFAQVQKIKAILTTFEDKTRLLRILDRTLNDQGIKILIGSEHGLDEIEGCSIITYPIRTEEKVIGSIGVIGPKRMNYQKIVAVVDTTARIVTRLMKRVVEDVV